MTAARPTQTGQCKVGWSSLKKCPERSSKRSLAKSSNILATKIADTFLQIDRTSIPEGPSLAWVVRIRKRGLLEKGSFQKCLFSRDSREFTDSTTPSITTPYFRVGFWQNGFFADVYFWAAGFFGGFCRRIFSPHFCEKKCPEKSSRKIPGKILQKFIQQKSPTHFCRGAGANLFRLSLGSGSICSEVWRWTRVAAHN